MQSIKDTHNTHGQNHCYDTKIVPLSKKSVRQLTDDGDQYTEYERETKRRQRKTGRENSSETNLKMTYKSGMSTG